MQVSLFHYLFLIQINRESIIPNDPSTVAATDAPAATLSGANDGHTTRPNNKKNTSQNSKGNRPGHYINSHSLRNAVTRRVQARSERNKLVRNANIILLQKNPVLQFGFMFLNELQLCLTVMCLIGLYT